MFELRDAEVPVEQPARRGGRRLPHRDGHAGQRPAERRGRLPGRDRGLPAEVVTTPRSGTQHGKPIGKHQLVQEHIAAIEMHRVTHRRDGDEGGRGEGRGDGRTRTTRSKARQADMLAAQAKFFASNAAWDAADRAVQVFGGRGWSTLYRPGRHLMDVRVCRIYEGTDEILKLKIAAGVLGKEYEAFK